MKNKNKRKYSRRELNKIASRRRILKASRRLFSAQGYDDTMIEEIADMAEVSKATVYNYFPNKESLLIGIVEEVLDRVEELLEKDLADCSNSLTKLRAALKEIVEASCQYPNLSRRITWLNADPRSRLYKERDEMIQILRKLIQASLKEGRLKEGVEIDEVVDAVMGIYLISLFQWPEKDEPIDAKFDLLFDRLLQAYIQE